MYCRKRFVLRRFYILNMKKNIGSIVKPLILLIAVAIIIFISRYFGVSSYLRDLRDWIHSFGAMASLVFTGVYIIAVVAALPGSVLTVMAGSLFGSVWGVVLVSIASTAGAALCFLIARYFARDSIKKWLKDKEKFRKLDSMTEKHGSFIVAIVRLIPIFPFNLVNYGFGLTGVKFGDYVLWSWVCMIPGTMLYVVGADAVTKAILTGKIPAITTFVFISTVILIILLVIWAKSYIKKGETSENIT